MKLLELTICEVRGIRHLTLKPDGKNIVISGPNGSGKSGVVDAIDFLLTGKIQRLTGKGTKAITLKQHGVHVGATAADTEVKALVSIAGYPKPLEIRRSISKPDLLIYPPEAETALKPVLDFAKSGQHVLSRREILKFITAESGDRATDIQAILNLNDVEEVRQSFVKARNTLKTESEGAQKGLKIAEANVAGAAQMARYSETELLDQVNTYRAAMTGPSLATLPGENLKQRLSAPKEQRQSSINPVVAEGDLKSLMSRLGAEAVAGRSERATDLIFQVDSLLRDTKLLVEADQVKLVELGVGMLDDTGACPLCDHEWPVGELTEYLGGKLARGSEARRALQEIQSLASPLMEELRSVRSTLLALGKTAAKTNSADATCNIEAWCGEIDRLEAFLTDPVACKRSGVITGSTIGALGGSENSLSSLSSMVKTVMEAAPTVSPEQTAWDLLTRIEEHWLLLVRAKIAAEVAKAAADRGIALCAAFESGRNQALQDLYDSIKARFVELYRDIHRTDEGQFNALIKPEGAGLTFEVDFFGNGSHPPHALHSEGHQDSMGLCLYLSLAEKLNTGIVDLIVLDDVVMSVDAGHRREVCRMLKKRFPERQFLITTHERAWAGQLRAECVVSSGNSINFYNWSLETGPCVDQSDDAWEIIRAALERDDVNRAAHALRYGLESFFRQACGNLRAQVPYNTSERWDLGDFMPSAVTRLRKYIKDAATSAKSWGKNDDAASLEEFESVLAQAFQKSQAEQWAINPNVHFNAWADFSRQDLEPVVETMQELCQQFKCSTCDGALEAQSVGMDVKFVKCPCGNVSLNLEKNKGKASK